MREKIEPTTNRIRRYCCWIKNPLSKEGITSEKQWVDATDLLDAAFQYFRKTGAYPTDILSEDSADMEERHMGGVYGYFREPADAINQKIALLQRKLEATEDRVESIQKQRDNFARSYEALEIEHRDLLENVWRRLDRVVDEAVYGIRAVEEMKQRYARVSPDAETEEETSSVDFDAPTSFFTANQSQGEYGYEDGYER